MSSGGGSEATMGPPGDRPERSRDPTWRRRSVQEVKKSAQGSSERLKSVFEEP